MPRKGTALSHQYSVLPDPNFARLYREGLNGLGATVAVLDTGLSRTSLLRGKGTLLHDFTEDDGKCEDGSQIQHGTVVASLIKRYAPGVRLMVAKVGRTTLASSSTYLVAKGLEWAYDNGADIINLSVGFPPNGCLSGKCVLCQMVQAVVQAGRVIVVAAGNHEGSLDMMRCPALNELAVTVGAVNINGQLAEYSVRAVGGRAKTDLLLASGTASTPAGTVQGTSFAAPVVSAAVAVIGATQGNYPEAVELLRRTGDPVSPVDRKPTGCGLINVPRAWEVARDATAAGTAQGPQF